MLSQIKYPWEALYFFPAAWIVLDFQFFFYFLNPYHERLASIYFQFQNLSLLPFEDLGHKYFPTPSNLNRSIRTFAKW